MAFFRAFRDSRPTTGGRLVYAIGDVHGRLDALEALIGRISEDARATAPPEPPLVVFLGDYVDRGPDSRGVLDYLLRFRAQDGFEVAALKGNHEDALLKFIDDPGFGPIWAAYWGEETLRSYGVAPPVDDAGCGEVRAAFAQALPAAHRMFLESLPLTLAVGDYLFVHAGVRPGVALADQAERDMMWIRHEFLRSDEDFGCVVVHGHTPTARPELRLNRIGIDTGAYASGVLTAVRLMGAERRFLQSAV